MVYFPLQGSRLIGGACLFLRDRGARSSLPRLVSQVTGLMQDALYCLPQPVDCCSILHIPTHSCISMPTLGRVVAIL